MLFVDVRFKPFSLTQCHLGLLFSVCTLALVTGCEQAGSARDTGGEPSVKKKVNENKVTAAEAEKFVKEYLSAIDQQDTGAIQQLVYWDVIVDRIFNGLSTDNVFHKQYSGGGKEILGKFAQSIQLETGDGGSYALLKIVRRGKDRHAIFRLVTGSSAPAGGGHINYHNLRLIKLDGQVRADDIYIARLGSWLSETYKNALQPVLLNSQKSALGFTSLQKEEMKGYRLTAEMVNAAKSGNHSEASKIYQQLPEDIRKTKAVLAARLLATERDEFFKAVDAMVSQYPDSPAVGLSLMDFGKREKDLQTVKRASEMLEKWTTGDSYIDLYVAAVTLNAGNVEEASELSREIDVREFDFMNPVYLKFKIALAAKDNVTLLECFRVLRDVHGENIKVILEADGCKDFVESLEYMDLKND